MAASLTLPSGVKFLSRFFIAWVMTVMVLSIASSFGFISLEFNGLLSLALMKSSSVANLKVAASCPFLTNGCQ